MRTFSARVSIGVALLALAVAGESAPRRPLPSFAVLAPGGGEVASAALVADGAWLLVYLRGDCAPCDRLLEVAARDERPAASRIVFVVGGADPDAVRTMAERHPTLAAARWLADPGEAAADALGVRTLPAVLGLRGPMIEWTLIGGLPEPDALESALFTWLERRDP